MATDQQRISIKIADTAPISLTIARDAEETIREAERNVNKVWAAWRRDFVDKNSREVLAMVAFQFAKLYYQLLNQIGAQESVLDEFEKELDRILLDLRKE